MTGTVETTIAKVQQVIKAACSDQNLFRSYELNPLPVPLYGYVRNIQGERCFCFWPWVWRHSLTIVDQTPIQAAKHLKLAGLLISDTEDNRLTKTLRVRSKTQSFYVVKASIMDPIAGRATEGKRKQAKTQLNEKGTTASGLQQLTYQANSSSGKSRAQITKLLHEAYSLYADHTDLGQPFIAEGVLWRVAQVLVHHLTNEGLRGQENQFVRLAIGNCLKAIDIYLDEMPSEKRSVFLEIEALCAKHATKPALLEPHKSDYSDPITDDLLKRIDVALPFTQEELSKGKVVSRFGWSGSKLLSIPDAGKTMNISRSSVYRLIDSGELPTVRIGGRVFVDQADIERLIADSRNVISQSK